MTTPDNHDDVARVARGLTQAQREAVLCDRSRGDSSYATGIGMGTHRALASRKLATCISGRGSMFSPQTVIQWPLTPLGLAVRAHLLAEQPR